MASSRRPPSSLASTESSAATVALNIAGAATDAVPFTKQILNSAARIFAAAERIPKISEAMYLLLEKADMYASQIDHAVAVCDINTSVQWRLERVYYVFDKIEQSVNDKLEGKSSAVRNWSRFMNGRARPEALATELDREIQLFNILTGIQMSILTDIKYDGEVLTEIEVSADTKDGKFRPLRDYEIERLDLIRKGKKDGGVVMLSTSHIKPQLKAIRYLFNLFFDTTKTSPISWGSYGIVYRFAHPDTGDHIAVKTLRVLGTENKELLEIKSRKLHAEASLYSRLHHDHIPAYFGLAKINCNQGLGKAIVTSWATGGTLKQYLESKRTGERRPLILGVIAALSYLHTQNPPIIHGDIHSSNVLLHGDKALLTDFGASPQLHGDNPRSKASGHMSYMAPELHMSDPPTWSPKSDIFAFAILTAEVYEGSLWEKNALKAVRLIVQGTRPKRPASHPVDLWPLTQACWHALPEFRPLTTAVYNAWRDQ